MLYGLHFVLLKTGHHCWCIRKGGDSEIQFGVPGRKHREGREREFAGALGSVEALRSLEGAGEWVAWCLKRVSGHLRAKLKGTMGSGRQGSEKHNCDFMEAERREF